MNRSVSRCLSSNFTNEKKYNIDIDGKELMTKSH
jgi:hypothetical protein